MYTKLDTIRHKGYFIQPYEIDNSLEAFVLTPEDTLYALVQDGTDMELFEDDIRGYIDATMPQLPKDGEPISFFELLTHLGGDEHE